MVGIALGATLQTSQSHQVDHVITLQCETFVKIHASVQNLYLFSDFYCWTDWIGDSFCDDETNTEECDFDGGDCCLDEVDTDYCTICECLTD